MSSPEEPQTSASSVKDTESKTSGWIPRRLDEDPYDTTTPSPPSEQPAQRSKGFESSWKPTQLEAEPIGDASDSFWDIGIRKPTVEEQIHDQRRHRRRWGIPIRFRFGPGILLILFILGFTGFLAAQTGVIPLGWKSISGSHYRTMGFSSLFRAPSDRFWGVPIGFTTFYLFEGQELYVDYDVKIKHGYLRIWVWSWWSTPSQNSENDSESPRFHKIRQSEKGRFIYSVKKSGLYNLSLDPMYAKVDENDKSVHVESFSFSLDEGKTGSRKRELYGSNLAYTVTWGIQ